MLKGEYIIPVVGQIYTNRCGSAFRCTRNRFYDSEETMRRSLALGEHIASMERVTDGWSLDAHGVILYEDGTIEWNYSTNGRFPG